ncbi:MAG: hydantoinase/carbamoylase family amidase [Candidatus Protistobacter heckmanni]|nr:hydantoinase/carbamoylase family amidase [Candidatus Protistobacter heckmanni]
MMTRTYLTAAHHAAAQRLTAWMRAAGNVIGRYESTQPGAPALLTGSHFDTVRNAGIYDGNLGVLLPITCIDAWSKAGRRFPLAIEVIGFAEEEGVRFKATLLDSRTLAGTFDTSVLDNLDEDGVSMRQAIDTAGLSQDGKPLTHADIPAATYRCQEVKTFVEVHIEQGPILLRNSLPLGIVTAISGATRLMVEVDGMAGHAGTTPMNMHQDAAAAAAEIVLAVAKRCSGKACLVGTVGQLGVPNGATNVVPGKAVLSIDIRAGEDAERQAAVADVLEEIKSIAARRKVKINTRKPLDAPSVRCGNGSISHNPLETMTAEDAAAAARVFAMFVESFA